MNKLEKLLIEKNLTAEKVARFAGARYLTKTIQKAIKEDNLTVLSYDTLETISSVLNVNINDLLKDTDINGITGKINRITNTSNKIKQLIETSKDEELIKKVSNNSYIVAINPKNFNVNMNQYLNLEPEIDVINKDIRLNSKEANSNYINNYVNIDGFRKRKLKKVKTILNTSNKNKAWAPCFIYSCSYHNEGVFLIGINIFKNNIFDFAQLFGCQWINNDIVYFKSFLNEPLTAENINICEKDVITEVEFNRSIFSQFKKFGYRP